DEGGQPLVQGKKAVTFLELLMRYPPPGVVGRKQLQRLQGYLAGLGKLALLQQSHAQSCVSVRIVGPESDSGAEGASRPFQVLLISQGNAEAGVGPGIVGIQFDGPAEGANRAPQVLLVMQGRAEVGVRCCIVGIQLDGPAVLPNGAL